MTRGCFITLEGGEGAGKSTAIETVIESIASRGIEVIGTREPGGTKLGESIRNLLLQNSAEAIVADAELLMIFAARAQHIEQVIEPALRAGCWVVSDRFTDASYAYQGGGRGIAASRIQQIEQWVQGSLRPQLTLFLDVSTEAGLQRVQKRSVPDRFESEDHHFFERVRRVYTERAGRETQRFCTICAEQPLEAMKLAIEKVIDSFLRQCLNRGEG